jgi:hypothetical protein
MASNLINPDLFEQLKSSLEADSTIKQEVGQIVDELETNVAYAQGVLSKVHSTPRSGCMYLLVHKLLKVPN